MTDSELLHDARDILITQTKNVQAERRPLARPPRAARVRFGRLLACEIAE